MGWGLGFLKIVLRSPRSVSDLSRGGVGWRPGARNTWEEEGVTPAHILVGNKPERAFQGSIAPLAVQGWLVGGSPAPLKLAQSRAAQHGQAVMQEAGISRSCQPLPHPRGVCRWTAVAGWGRGRRGLWSRSVSQDLWELQMYSRRRTFLLGGKGAVVSGAS